MYQRFVRATRTLFVLFPTLVHAGLLRKRVDDVITKSETGLKAKPLAELVGLIINAGLSLLGTIFLALLVYGGYVWMQAQGDEEDVKRAQGIIRQAIIGLIIVMAAGAITFFVTRSIEKATIE